MRRGGKFVLSAAALLALAAPGRSRAQAKGPAFDCGKAQGEVEQLICKDESLAALDRKIDLHQRKRAILDDLFKALLHKLMTGEIAVAELDLTALDRPAFPEGASS